MNKITYNEKEVGEAVLNTDGYFVFFPIHIDGYWDAGILHSIASTLDEMNREWDAMVNAQLFTVDFLSPCIICNAPTNQLSNTYGSALCSQACAYQFVKDEKYLNS